MIYLSSMEKNTLLHRFSDSMPLPPQQSATSNDSLLSIWLAERLLQANPMNLCQGELQHDTRQQSNKQWYRAAAIIAGLLIVSVFLFKGFYLHSLNTNIADIDKKIAVIYHEFFPDALRVTSPKFRIGQLLNADKVTTDTASLKSLLDKLAYAMNDRQITVKQLQFQRQILSVTLISEDFAALESLQQRLQQASVKVTQEEASSHDHHVAAKLELSL